MWEQCNIEPDASIEQEMTSCLSEMEKLQAKMMNLQNKQQKEKTNYVKPNMKVMEKWLDTVIGERKNAKRAKKFYESFTKDMQENIPVTIEKRQEIWKLRRVYYNNSLDKWMPPNQEPLFHNTNHKSPDTVSQFMIDYIEATHNLFEIQQKQINELQSIVLKLNAKKDIK